MLLWTLLACAEAPPPDAEAPSTTLMTFNIRYDLGLSQVGPDDWASAAGPRRDRVMATIDAAAPDLLGVQEALLLQVNDLRDHLAGYGLYAVGRDDGDLAGEACAIAWREDRYEVEETGTFWLSPTPDVPGSQHPDAATVRIASWARLRDDGAPVLVVNTHWDHVSAVAREDAAATMVARVGALRGDARVVVMGDLNADEDAAAVVALREGLGLVDAYRVANPTPRRREATFHDWTGDADGVRIDHVLLGGAWDVEGADLVRDAVDGRWPSDHFPVVVRAR